MATTTAPGYAIPAGDEDRVQVFSGFGHHVFYNFSIDEFGEPIYHEA